MTQLYNKNSFNECEVRILTTILLTNELFQGQIEIKHEYVIPGTQLRIDMVLLPLN